MLMEKERNDIVTYGMRLISDGLTAGTAGNISIYNPESGYMAISPSGIPYADTKPEDVVVMDLDGNIIDGKAKPSSEHGLHAVFYKNCPEARAVVHAHSMYCTTLACLGQPLRSVHYALAEALTDELPLVPYHTYGTQELAEDVAAHLNTGSHALLLANHGMIAYGDTIQSAFGLALTCEWCAEVQWRCMVVGQPSVLNREQMETVMEHYKTYGQVAEDGSRRHGYNG